MDEYQSLRWKWGHETRQRGGGSQIAFETFEHVPTPREPNSAPRRVLLHTVYPSPHDA